VHGKGDSEFDVVQALLRKALPVVDAYPPTRTLALAVLPALVYRDFELLRYGVGAFFAEHVDRCGPGMMLLVVVVVVVSSSSGLTPSLAA
jgi:hypothetical protein